MTVIEFCLGITSKNLDGVVAFYATNGIKYSELFFIVTDLLVNIPFHTSCIISGLVCK